MHEYIDREAAIKQLDGLIERDVGGVFGLFAETRRVLCELPAADVALVHHGKEDTGLTQSDIKDMRNELCLLCGKYKMAHEGACNGCRWRKE